MKGMRTVLTIAAGASAVFLMGAAKSPTALSQTSGGSWEITGLPGTGEPIRRCIGNTISFAQIEHRGQSCTQVVISDTPTTALVHYTCTNGGFGRTELTLLTPRSLRVQTQGISNGAPFNYVVQARRMGTCPSH